MAPICSFEARLGEPPLPTCDVTVAVEVACRVCRCSVPCRAFTALGDLGAHLIRHVGEPLVEFQRTDAGRRVPLALVVAPGSDAGVEGRVGVLGLGGGELRGELRLLRIAGLPQRGLARCAVQFAPGRLGLQQHLWRRRSKREPILVHGFLDRSRQRRQAPVQSAGAHGPRRVGDVLDPRLDIAQTNELAVGPVQVDRSLLQVGDVVAVALPDVDRITATRSCSDQAQDGARSRCWCG